jgi:uncharacterized cupredoxin-like copper-binding protein
VKPRWALAVGLAVAVLVTAGGYAVAAGARPAVDPLGPAPVTVVLDVEHSDFLPDAMVVEAGTTVRFVVDNSDPINHEFILGPPAVHARHRDGTERRHPPVPGEVTVPAQSRAVTTYTFDEVGPVEFACHLPAHYEYGMRGVVTVVAEG